MKQMDADGESDKRTAQELERPCLARHPTAVEALVSKACDKQAVGATASRSAPGPRLHYRRLVFNLRPSARHLRIVGLILVGLRRSFVSAASLSPVR